MVAVLRRQPYRWAKPPAGAVLDRAHPLAQGLRFCLPHLEGGGGRLVNACNPGEVHQHTLTTSKWVTTPFGSAIEWLAQGGANMNRALDWGGADLGTIAVAAFEPSALSNYTVIWESSADTNGGAGRFGLYANVSAPARIEIHHQHAGGSNLQNIPWVAGAHVYAGTFGEGATVGYRDGVQVLSAGSSTRGAFSTQTPSYGARNGSSAPLEALAVAGLWVWTRRLSVAEIEWHAADPWAMFAPPARRLWIVPAGGTDATATTTVGNLSLAGQPVTASAGGFVAAAVGNVALAGQAVAAAAGATALPIAGHVALAGQVATANAGATALPTVGNVALAGQAATASTGVAAATTVGDVALAGRAVVADDGNAGLASTSPGNVALAGQAVVAAAGASAAAAVGNTALGGQVATALWGATALPLAGNVALGGLSLSASDGSVVPPVMTLVAPYVGDVVAGASGLALVAPPSGLALVEG